MWRRWCRPDPDRASPSWNSDRTTFDLGTLSSSSTCDPPASSTYYPDWGSVDPNNAISSSSELQQRLEDNFDASTTSKN
ncbi:hypothetical protein FF1_022772 [Malus domestica]